MLVDDHRQRDVGDRQPLDGRAVAEERSRRPARFQVSYTKEIGREATQLGGGPNDELVDLGARQQADSYRAIVEVDAGRCTRDRLHAQLEPWLIERVQDDEHREHGQGRESGETREGAPQPPPRTTRVPTRRNTLEAHANGRPILPHERAG